MSTPPSGGGQFISPSDVRPGDTATIKTEADWIDSQFTKEDGSKKQQYVCVVDYDGEDRKLKLTIASCDELKVFGKNSLDWIGKKVQLEVVKVMVGGKMKNSIFVKPYGSGVDQPQTQTAPPSPQPPKYDAEGNEIQWDDEEET